MEAVLFDYGGVLTVPVADSIRAWHAEEGIDPASFSRTLKAWLSRSVEWETPIHRLETGVLDVEEFESAFAAELTTLDGGTPSAPGILGRMFAQMRPDPEMFELVEQLRDCGIRVGLLSNSWGNTYPRELIDPLFGPVVISGEIGLRKPQREIYRYAVELLGVPEDRVVFVDDAMPNIVGARVCGLRSVLHASPRATRSALEALIPALSPPSAEVCA
ncbi:MAG: HAD family phosphatase [Nocardioides sp.]|uniref:HAD family hydrolase n=1 Tax=Nocardioides sp. TaxID=35761 RepID=UPI0039E5BB13